MGYLARPRKSFVAIVDDDWLGLYGGTPRQWALAGRWKFSDRVVLAPPALSFYALTEAARLQLVANLRDFSSRLPDGVEQLGPYMEAVRPRPLGRDDPGRYGTIPFSQYAWAKTKALSPSGISTLCQNVRRRISPSWPIKPTVVTPTAIF